ncbi:hypothetical protein [Neobacillus niacini]|uniref:hypothetical protein n=1 Tax=Neobacillus niacini TaxID=86668 RepID=UPI0021CB65D8|nr:hypothetical protein [Neobacillus niacini]MCM3764766.1 hypothetical protein [Neobacillus niacini]
MELNYQNAQRLKGKVIQYRNKEGEMVIGRVANVRKDGLEIEELSTHQPSEGYGFGFWGPGPFFRPPVFFPFVGFGIGFPFFW